MNPVASGAVIIGLLAVLSCGPDKPSGVSDTNPPPKSTVKSRPIHALVLGDRTGHPDDDVFISVLRKAKRLGPDLIIGVGDLIDGYQPDAHLDEAEAEWQHVMGLIRRVFGPDIPLFSAAGNHDVWSDKSEALFETHLGHHPNFSFEMGEARIILFDTSRADNEVRIPDEDLDWLAKELWYGRDYAARVVVTHRTLWALNPGGAYGDPLHDVYIAGNADWVISGHWHHAMAHEIDGIRYRMLGPSGGRPNRGTHPESGNFQQFGWLVVDNGEVDFSILDIDGVHRADAFPYAFNQLEYKIERRAVIATGFEMNPQSPKTAGRVALTVTNVSNERLTAPLTFDNRDWTIAPNRVDLALAPGDVRTQSFRFTRRKDAPLFPGPVLTLPFEWPGGGKYVLEKAITPTLTWSLPSCEEAPVLDGALDDGCWKKTAPIGTFHETKGGSPPAVSVRTARTKQTLYIAAQITPPKPSDAPRAPSARDTYLETEDHFLVLVDDDSDTPAYVRVAVNRDGTIYDRLNGTGEAETDELAWNEAKAAVKNNDDHWTVEIAVPLAPKDAAQTRVGFNFSAKEVNGGDYGVGWWQPLKEHNRDSFGVLVSD